jgi:hypothetical protein
VILLRPWCWIVGHRRGKRVRRVTPDDGASIWQVYACPRCGRETRYKIKPLAALSEEERKEEVT